MPAAKLKPAYILTTLIIILTLIASVGGILFPGLYRDNAVARSAWSGNDIVTLLVAVPLLIGALALSRRGSPRAQLVWLGMLDYVLYNYAFYLFGAAFNVFFLIYVALFTLAIFALIFGLVGVDAQGIGEQFNEKTPARWIGGYMVVWALMLGILWIVQALGFVFTGDLPSIVTAVEHPTSIVFALDLSLLVPFVALGAVWLWQRKPWGFVLATIINVKGAVYALALTAASISGGLRGIEGSFEQVPLWGVFVIASLLSCVFLLRNLKPAAE